MKNIRSRAERLRALGLTKKADWTDDVLRDVESIKNNSYKQGYDDGFKAGLLAGGKLAGDIENSLRPKSAINNKRTMRKQAILIIEADATLKAMFERIMDAIDKGHIDEKSARGLREKLQLTLADWLNEQRQSTQA